MVAPLTLSSTMHISSPSRTIPGPTPVWRGVYVFSSSIGPMLGCDVSYSQAVELCSVAVWKTRTAMKRGPRKKWYWSESCRPG
jgi:hypothetical protein